MRLFNSILRLFVRRAPMPAKLRYKAMLFAVKYVRGTIIYRDRFGNRLLLELGNFLDSLIYVEDGYEPETIDYVRRMIRETGARRFIDIGANMGIFSLTMASTDGIDRCDAFEPDPRNFSQLQANIFLNHH